MCVKGLFLFFLLLFLFFLLFFFFLFFFFLLFFFCWCFTSFIIIIGRFWFSWLLAWAFSEPLGQFGLWPLRPFCVLLLPQSLEMLSPYNFPTAFVQLSSVFVCSCVSSAFIFGVHANLGWIFSCKGFGVQAFLHGLLSELLLLSLLELFEIVVLSFLSLFKIVFFSLLTYNGIPKFSSLVVELFAIHGVQVQRLDADGQGNFLFLFQLLFGFGHFTAGILDISHSAVGFLWSLSTLSSSLSLLLSLFQAFSLLFSLLCFFVGFLFP